MLPRCMSSSDFYVLGPRLEHFSVLGFWDHGILTFFYSQITSDDVRFYVPFRFRQFRKMILFTEPCKHPNIHTVLEYEFKTEPDVINSSIITNFYLYIFVQKTQVNEKIGENVTKSSLMIEFFLNVYIGLICIKKWQELLTASQVRSRPWYCHLWSIKSTAHQFHDCDTITTSYPIN